MNSQTNLREIYKAMELVDSYTRCVPGEDQLSILDDSYSIYKDVIDAAILAAKSLQESSEGASKLADLEKYLKEENSSIDGEGLALELVNSPEFAHVIDAAKLSSGKTQLKGIGLGVSYHYARRKEVGIEEGVEGIIIFPKTVGNTRTPMQAATRQWYYETKQIRFDLIARAGFNISFWFATPISSDLLAGVQAELGLILAASFNVTGAVPMLPSLTETVGRLTWPAVINTLSVSAGLGLGAGGSTIRGSQDVSLKDSLTTLFVINTATNTAVMKVGESTTLEITLFYPYAGGGPVVILNNNETTTATLTIEMPSFLSDSLDEAEVKLPSGWKQTEASDGAFNFEYTGTDQQAWNTNLEFTISKLESNSGISGEQTGPVTASMDGTTSTRNFNLPVQTTPASLQLTPLEFTASINWNVDIDTATGFTIAGVASGGPTDVVAPLQGFQPLPYQSGTPIIVIDPDGIEWYVGFKFQISNNQPVLLAAWQQVGSPAIPNKSYFPSGQYTVNDSTPPISIPYKNNSSYNTTLTINATLKS